MSATTLELPSLYVEGQTDLFTIVHLLARHTIVLDRTTGPVIINNVQNDAGVLRAMGVAAKASTHLPVGFVIDADVSLNARWKSVCAKLQGLGLTLPDAPPPDGFIGEANNKARIGVWIMPDNSMDEGQLEHLVETLVPENDNLFGLACKSTAEAVAIGASFPSQYLKKAELHCWLAWQKEPGASFGLAIQAHFLNHDSDVSRSFVKWFKTLFNL